MTSRAELEPEPRRGFVERVVSWLGARWAPAVAVLVGLALSAPALTAPFAVDDHLHRVIMRDDPGIAGMHARPVDLFVFANGEPTDNNALRDVGVFSWWTDPHLKLAFFRPLSSATHAVDHALWPENATAQLAHNLVWLAIALVAVWAFYRRFLSARWIAVLALALYAVDDARGPVVGWIANRNGLIALALAIPVLLAHDRWRRDGWTPGRWLGPLALAVALGAGESSLAIGAYLAAHALWLDRGRWPARLAALAPYGLVVVAWRVLYTHLGYGVVGSGIYLDPGADPGAFVGAALERVPLLLFGQLGPAWADFSSFYELLAAGLMTVMVGLALGFLALVGLAAARLVRHDPVSRFFVTGMVLAAVPVASTFPADRLLGFIGLGGMGLVAQLIAAGLRHREQLGTGRLRRGLALAVVWLLVLIHVVLAPPLLLVRARTMVTIGRVVDRADAGVPHDPAIAGQTVVIAAAPSDALAAYLPIMRASRHQVRPGHLYWLATAISAVTFERVDARTLRVTPEGGFLRHDVDQMLRSPRALPFAVGDTVRLSGITIVVEAITPDRRPAHVLARFDRPLEDPGWVWRRWEGRTYVPFTPPPIGQRVTLPPVDVLGLLTE